MKAIPTITAIFLTVGSTSFAEVAASAPSGAFTVNQKYKGDYVENITFRDPTIPPVSLAGFPWPGLYDISPDENWILRTQKTGSGDNVAILYHIEKNGRVSEVLGFNDMLWALSDATSRLKAKDLYHTGVASIVWAKDSTSVEIVLNGSNASKSGDGIEASLIYNLKNNKVTVKPTNNKEQPEDKPHKAP